MNNTKFCFYGISRGDDRRDNPNFFESNRIILIPWNYLNIHWVLLFVDMEMLEFAVMDSLNDEIPPKQIETEMNNMIRFLCTLKNEEQKDNSDWKNINRHNFK